MNFDISAEGMKGLKAAMEQAGDIPPDVRKRMVKEQGRITAESVVFFAGTMLTGPYNEYGVARSVTAKAPKLTKDGAYVEIIFKGTQHGNRLGEIAFVNEYGKKSQPARPFIKTAIKDARDPAADAAHKILDEFLKKTGL